MSNIRDRIKSVFVGKDKKDFHREVGKKRSETTQDGNSKSGNRQSLEQGGAAPVKTGAPDKIDKSDKDVEINDPKKMPQKLADLNKRYEKVLKYRGIQPNDKRYKAMMSKPPDEKWKIILLHDKSVAEQEVRNLLLKNNNFFIYLCTCSLCEILNFSNAQNSDYIFLSHKHSTVFLLCAQIIIYFIHTHNSLRIDLINHKINYFLEFI